MGNRSSSIPTHPDDRGDSSNKPLPNEKVKENKVKEFYDKLLANEKVKEMLQKSFREVRILVVGRSGCGKSTLIRVLIGDNGPRTIADGHAGVQDIMAEWRHPDPALPLVIHDSNGIDVIGNDRKADIKKFLDDRVVHLASKSFAERVHAVWYVFSGMDNRVLEDCGLLEMLDSYDDKALPLLLIMTNDDIVQKLTPESVKVNVKVLEKLLGKIKNQEKRKRLKESMVRVGNLIKMDEDTGEILKDKSVLDSKGMDLVFQRTKQMLDKKLWITWMACQVIDMNAKLEASTKLIVGRKKQQMCAGYVVATLPLAQQLELAAVFGTMTRGLAMIWNVSENLEKAISSTFLLDKRWEAVKQNLATNIAGALLLAGALTATVFTAGIAAPSLLLAAAPAIAQAKSTSTLVASYGLYVLGCIIYIRTHEIVDGQGSFDDYSKLCEEFVASDFAKDLSLFSENNASVWETWFQSGRLQSNIEEFFRKFMLEKCSLNPSSQIANAEKTQTSEPQSQIADVAIDAGGGKQVI